MMMVIMIMMTMMVIMIMVMNDGDHDNDGDDGGHVMFTVQAIRALKLKAGEDVEDTALLGRLMAYCSKVRICFVQRLELFIVLCENFYCSKVRFYCLKVRFLLLFKDYSFYCLKVGGFFS